MSSNSSNSKSPYENSGSHTSPTLTQSPCNIAEKKRVKEMYVDPVLLDSLISIGIDGNLSKKALACTENKSVDLALQWIAELGAEEMEALCHEMNVSSDGNSDSEECEEDVSYKMAFVVNGEYGMGTGKIASQVGHAALGLYRLLESDREKYWNSVEEWEDTGEKKITLRGKSSAELLQLQTNAEKNELPTYIVEDVGKTQIPEGALTVLGIFGDEDAVNDVTGHLRLL